jgi:polysaccharide biosynthesis protein PslG
MRLVSLRTVPRRFLIPALLGLWAAVPLPAEDASPYGVNAHAPAGAELVLGFDRVREAGIGWVRIDFVWALIETSQGHFDWSVYDAIVDAAEARGISVLGILAYTPGWATDGAPLSGPPRNVADWEDFCYRAAFRYRGRVTHWELWNEPNQPAFWGGTRQQYIDWILVPGADAVHAADSRARAGGPALAHLESAKWYDWLLEVLQRGGGKLDFATHHLYDSDGPADMAEKLEAETPFGGNPDLWDLWTPSVKEVLAEAHWGKPLWLDETGWASKKIDETKQAAHLAGLLDDWTSGDPARAWLAKIFVYELRDGAPEIDPNGFGLLRADGSPKPAYGAYRDFIAAHTAPAPQPLELFGGRFAIAVRWHNVSTGETGYGHPLPFSDETGLFWFFDPGNVELIVKSLDGRAVNDRYWLFYGALSDVEYWVTVEDGTTGAIREYHNAPGTYCGKADTSAFTPVTGGASVFGATAAYPSASAEPKTLAPLSSPLTACVADVDTLCLQDGRFAVEVDWSVPRDGSHGKGRKVNTTNQSGYFWFFDADNLELVVKVLDGRAVNGRFWVFYGALSDVEYWVRVTDTQSGKARQYHNVPGSYCGRADVNAF